MFLILLLSKHFFDIINFRRKKIWMALRGVLTKNSIAEKKICTLFGPKKLTENMTTNLPEKFPFLYIFWTYSVECVIW